jgi:hypothetical protein
VADEAGLPLTKRIPEASGAPTTSRA